MIFCVMSIFFKNSEGIKEPRGHKKSETVQKPEGTRTSEDPQKPGNTPKSQGDQQVQPEISANSQKPLLQLDTDLTELLKNDGQSSDISVQEESLRLAGLIGEKLNLDLWLKLRYEGFLFIEITGFPDQASFLESAYKEKIRSFIQSILLSIVKHFLKIGQFEIVSNSRGMPENPAAQGVIFTDFVDTVAKDTAKSSGILRIFFRKTVESPEELNKRVKLRITRITQGVIAATSLLFVAVNAPDDPVVRSFLPEQAKISRLELGSTHEERRYFFHKLDKGDGIHVSGIHYLYEKVDDSVNPEFVYVYSPKTRKIQYIPIKNYNFEPFTPLQIYSLSDGGHTLRCPSKVFMSEHNFTKFFNFSYQAPEILIDGEQVFNFGSHPGPYSYPPYMDDSSDRNSRGETALQRTYEIPFYRVSEFSDFIYRRFDKGEPILVDGNQYDYVEAYNNILVVKDEAGIQQNFDFRKHAIEALVLKRPTAFVFNDILDETSSKDSRKAQDFFSQIRPGDSIIMNGKMYILRQDMFRGNFDSVLLEDSNVSMRQALIAGNTYEIPFKYASPDDVFSYCEIIERNYGVGTIFKIDGNKFFYLHRNGDRLDFVNERGHSHFFSLKGDEHTFEIPSVQSHL